MKFESEAMLEPAGDIEVAPRKANSTEVPSGWSAGRGSITGGRYVGVLNCESNQIECMRLTRSTRSASPRYRQLSMPCVARPGGVEPGLNPPCALSSRSGLRVTVWPEVFVPPVEKARKFGRAEAATAKFVSSLLRP